MTFPRVDFALLGALGSDEYCPARILFSVCVSIRVMPLFTRLASGSLLMASWKSTIGQTVYPGHESVPAGAGVGEGACADAGIASVLRTITPIAGRVPE